MQVFGLGIEELIPLVGVLACTALFIFSAKARQHVRRAFKTIRHAETTNAERAGLIAAVLLIGSGAIIPGPFDELLGFALIAKIIRRVERRIDVLGSAAQAQKASIERG